MRTWERVTYQERCGACGTLLSADAPMQTITRHGLKRKLLRCVLCAEGEAPPDLPSRPARLSVEERVGQIAMQPLQTAMPDRTRGALKQMATATIRDEWMPYRETREPGEDDP